MTDTNKTGKPAMEASDVPVKSSDADDISPFRRKAQREDLTLEKSEERLQWERAIQEASELHDLDPALLASLIFQESSWNPRAVSKAGAQGLLQFMPSTAKDVGLDDPFDPIKSIQAGAKYIKWVINRMPEGTPLKFAVGAYNAGATRMKRWINKYGHTDPPVEETKNYMNDIIERMEDYDYLRKQDFDWDDSSSGCSTGSV